MIITLTSYERHGVSNHPQLDFLQTSRSWVNQWKYLRVTDTDGMVELWVTWDTMTLIWSHCNVGIFMKTNYLIIWHFFIVDVNVLVCSRGFMVDTLKLHKQALINVNNSFQME